VFPPSTSHQPQDAGLARNRRAAPSTPTRAPSLSVSAIFNFGQDNKTSEDTKQESGTEHGRDETTQQNNVTNGGPAGFFESAGAVFRSKSGGVGDVLEQNVGEGSESNYSGDVHAPSNDDPIDGVVVDGHAAMEEAALLAADLKAGASPASSEDAMDDLYNEIAAKNGVDLDERVLDDDANDTTSCSSPRPWTRRRRPRHKPRRRRRQGPPSRSPRWRWTSSTRR
jgi:hypothetical protein